MCEGGSQKESAKKSRGGGMSSASKGESTKGPPLKGSCEGDDSGVGDDVDTLDMGMGTPR